MPPPTPQGGADCAPRAQPPALAAELQSILDRYRPLTIDADTWVVIRGVHHAVMVRSGIRGENSFVHRCGDLAAYLAWRTVMQLPVAIGEAMTFAALDDYHRRGDHGALSDRSWDERHSKLRNLARKANPGLDAPSPAATVGHQAVKAPYTHREETRPRPGRSPPAQAPHPPSALRHRRPVRRRRPRPLRPA